MGSFVKKYLDFQGQINSSDIFTCLNRNFYNYSVNNTNTSPSVTVLFNGVQLVKYQTNLFLITLTNSFYFTYDSSIANVIGSSDILKTVAGYFIPNQNFLTMFIDELTLYVNDNLGGTGYTIQNINLDNKEVISGLANQKYIITSNFNLEQLNINKDNALGLDGFIIDSSSCIYPILLKSNFYTFNGKTNMRLFPNYQYLFALYNNDLLVATFENS